MAHSLVDNPGLKPLAKPKLWVKKIKILMILMQIQNIHSRMAWRQHKDLRGSRKRNDKERAMEKAEK